MVWVADCQAHCKKLQTCKSTADCFRLSQTCLLSPPKRMLPRPWLAFQTKAMGKKPKYIKECNSAVQLCNLASNGRSEKLTWSVLYCVQYLLYCSIQCVVQCPVLRMSDKRRGFLVQSCLPQEAWAASKIELHGWLRFQHQGDSRWMEWRRLEMRHPKVSTLAQL